MNFLAHLYLSGSNEKVMVGNFIGDFVKGKQFENYEPDIKKGILLHRHIDEYTDQHLEVMESKKRLWPKYSHYAGVIVDMFYDHFLAANWPLYHSLPLAQYTQQVYTTLSAHESLFPKGAQYMFPFMVKHNWLSHYAEKEGINRALAGMSKRTKFQSKMDEAVTDLTLYYPDFQREFESFFPEVRHFTEKWLQRYPEI